MIGSEKTARLGVAALSSVLALWASAGSAQPVRWTTYTIPQTGTSLDFPASIFTEEAGKPDGQGQRFRTSDGRADMTIQVAPNVSNDTPAAFLEKKASPRAHPVQKDHLAFLCGLQLQRR